MKSVDIACDPMIPWVVRKQRRHARDILLKIVGLPVETYHAGAGGSSPTPGVPPTAAAAASPAVPATTTTTTKTCAPSAGAASSRID
eukprot:3289044-Amphidinium_carterae.2